MAVADQVLPVPGPGPVAVVADAVPVTPGRVPGPGPVSVDHVAPPLSMCRVVVWSPWCDGAAEAMPTDERRVPPARATVAAPRARARLNPSVIEDRAFLHCHGARCPADGRADRECTRGTHQIPPTPKALRNREESQKEVLIGLMRPLGRMGSWGGGHGEVGRCPAAGGPRQLPCTARRVGRGCRRGRPETVSCSDDPVRPPGGGRR